MGAGEDGDVDQLEHKQSVDEREEAELRREVPPCLVLLGLHLLALGQVLDHHLGGRSGYLVHLSLFYWQENTYNSYGLQRIIFERSVLF